MKIVFTGGGSGGHIFPIVAIARELRRLSNNSVVLYYIGPKDELASIYLKQENFLLKNIFSGKVRRYLSLKNILDIFKLPIGFLQSLYNLSLINPSIVFSKGGSGSLLVTFAAYLLRIPVFIHESDSVPGLSNQKSAKFAKKIFISFEQTSYFDKSKCILVGNPIRHEVLEGDITKAQSIFGLTLSKPILLFIGGSQGAEAINDFVLNSILKLLENYEVIHMTGRQNFESVTLEAEAIINENLSKYYHPIDFLDEEKLKHAYKAADLIIARAGSGTIFEIAALGKPSITIPLPTAANNHQFQNAYQYANSGATLVLEQDNLTVNFFFETLQLLLLNEERLSSMKESALKVAKPLAAKAIAREILEF